MSVPSKMQLNKTTLTSHKPLVITGNLAAGIRTTLLSQGFRLIPSLSPRAQLLIGSEPSLQLLREAREKGCPIFREKDINIAAVDNKRLWVDKFRPKSLEEVIGHKEQIAQLTEWLKVWPAKGVAALITGPPGIGKTTVAHLVSTHLGYKVNEYNASDMRNASDIACILQTDSARLKKEVIIMDEVDGMSESDRGGIAAIAAVIRNGGSGAPILCIANDRGAQKLRPLTSVCVDVRFSRPVKTIIARALRDVLARENLSMSVESLTQLCEQNGNDIRSIINQCQLDNTMNRIVASDKDSLARYDAFSATQRLFNLRKELSLQEAEQLFFVDHAMVPLMIQEAYLSTTKDMDVAAKAADMISQADTIDARIHRHQAWHLLPDYALTMLAPTRWTTSPAPYNLFPQWLGRFSKHQKHLRHLRTVAQRTHISATVLRLDHWEPINVISRGATTQPKEFISVLDKLRLTRDDYFDLFQETCFDPVLIPAKEKAAITREYNKLMKKKKHSSTTLNMDEEGEGDEDSDDLEPYFH
jgi:replication factor C subunit 1